MGLNIKDLVSLGGNGGKVAYNFPNLKPPFQHFFSHFNENSNFLCCSIFFLNCISSFEWNRREEKVTQKFSGPCLGEGYGRMSAQQVAGCK